MYPKVSIKVHPAIAKWVAKNGNEIGLEGCLGIYRAQTLIPDLQMFFSDNSHKAPSHITNLVDGYREEDRDAVRGQLEIVKNALSRAKRISVFIQPETLALGRFLCVDTLVEFFDKGNESFSDACLTFEVRTGDLFLFKVRRPSAETVLSLLVIR